MSVLDYMKDIQLFDSYQLKTIQMVIEQLKLKQNKMFSFLDDIDLNQIQFFWYSDSEEDVLGGFHFPSGNAIYINRNCYCDCNLKLHYTAKTNRIIAAFPVIMHEIYHYWQFVTFSLIYIFLQLPLIRQFTIQVNAYKISDYLYDNNTLINLSPKEIVLLKQKYNFDINYYDERQKKMMVQ